MKRFHSLQLVRDALLPALLAVATSSLVAQTPTPSPSPAPSSSEIKGSLGPASASGEAWKALADQSVQPMPPTEWRTKRPEKAEIEAWAKTEQERLIKLSDALHDYYVKFPQSDTAGEAKMREYQAALFLYRFVIGDAPKSAAAVKRLESLEDALLKDPARTAQERFEIRATQMERNAQTRDDREKAARALIKEFPGIEETYGLLLESAARDTDERSRAIANEILKSPASQTIKGQAQQLLTKIESIGKPLAIKYTAIDGREIDVQAMKGKVVLIDFWATWCGPCVRELPNVKATYDRLHEKGFEIVGISFDVEKEKLEAFVKENKMAWPQFYDGKRWQNEFGVKFGIQSIPSMWLVDKKGILRDLSARKGLADKVEKLLAEP